MRKCGIWSQVVLSCCNLTESTVLTSGWKYSSPADAVPVSLISGRIELRNTISDLPPSFHTQQFEPNHDARHLELSQCVRASAWYNRGKSNHLCVLLSARDAPANDNTLLPHPDFNPALRSGSLPSMDPRFFHCLPFHFSSGKQTSIFLRTHFLFVAHPSSPRACTEERGIYLQDTTDIEHPKNKNTSQCKDGTLGSP